MWKKYCVDEKQTILDAVSVIQKELARCSVVVNAEGRVVGVFSEGDVLRAMLKGIEPHTPLKSIVRASFLYQNAHDLRQAFKTMKQKGVTLIPVISDEFKLLSVITLGEVMEHLEFAREGSAG